MQRTARGQASTSGMQLGQGKERGPRERERGSERERERQGRGVVVTYSANMTLYLSAFYRRPGYLGKTEPCAWGMRLGAGVGLCLPHPPEEEEKEEEEEREGERSP